MENGSLEAELSSRQSKAVDFAVSGMIDPWRTAIAIQARNLYTGHDVWESPRVPKDRVRVILCTARGMLTVRLISAGVMG